MNWKAGAKFFKKYGVLSYSWLSATSVNLFLWRMYVIIIGVQTTVLKV